MSVVPDDPKHQWVWLIWGFYRDGSGGKLLGVYELESAAMDRVSMLREAGSQYQINYAKVAVNKFAAVELL